MILVIGVGNPYRSDLWIGGRAIRVLEGKMKEKDLQFLVTSRPEAHLESIQKMNPDRIIIISALDLGLAPGYTKFLSTANIGLVKNPEVRAMVDYLKSNTKAIVSIIGIQPKKTSYGSVISKEVEEAIEKVEGKIREFMV